MADGTVREIVDDRTDRHDWDFGGTAVATHFRHGDVSNLDTSLGHKAILHNLNGERTRRILDDTDSVAAPCQVLVDTLPAGAVHETAVDKDDRGSI